MVIVKMNSFIIAVLINVYIWRPFPDLFTRIFHK